MKEKQYNCLMFEKHIIYVHVFFSWMMSFKNKYNCCLAFCFEINKFKQCTQHLHWSYFWLHTIFKWEKTFFSTFQLLFLMSTLKYHENFFLFNDKNTLIEYSVNGKWIFGDMCECCHENIRKKHNFYFNCWSTVDVICYLRLLLFS